MNIAQFTHLIYSGSFLVFPFFASLVWLWLRHKKRSLRLLLVFLGILSILFVWARFVEPQIIITRTTQIQTGFPARIILIADTHLGVYKKAGFLKRVVDHINAIEADAVLIAGDFTYVPKEETLPELMAALKQSNKPVFAILGNHDTEHPGQPIRNALSQVLKENGVELLNNDIRQMDGFTLLGLGELWSGEADVSLLKNIPAEENLVILTHNPDAALEFPNSAADITLAGHTHCGQIRIPWLYKKAIPTKGNFDKGFTEESFGKLFITCGLGEVGLPMRLFNPPVIDVLELK